MGLSGYTLLFSFVLAGVFGAYFWWSQGQIEDLNRSLAREISARKSTQTALKSLRNNVNESTKKLEEIQEQNNRIRNKANKLEEMLARHDFGYLAAEKPGLIERRVNNATDVVLDDLRNASSAEWEPETEGDNE